MRDLFNLGVAPDPAAVDRGRKVYVASCGFCQGTNANGGNSGPDLVRSVLVLHDEGPAREIGPVIRNHEDRGISAEPQPVDGEPDGVQDPEHLTGNWSQTTLQTIDCRTGDVVWAHPLPNRGGVSGLLSGTSNGPITYELDGAQYVTVGAGNTLYAFRFQQ